MLGTRPGFAERDGADLRPAEGFALGRRPDPLLGHFFALSRKFDYS